MERRLVTCTLIMACLFYLLLGLLAKPIHNLALRVFQQYYVELCEALTSSLEKVAVALYSNGLVTRQERNQVDEVLGLTDFDKADILMHAVGRKIVAENGSAPLKKFCHVLRRHHGVGSIVSRMKFWLSEWIR